jgi:hypothetical protein
MLLKKIKTKVVDEMYGSKGYDCEDYCFWDVMLCSFVDISKVLENPVISTFTAVKFG